MASQSWNVGVVGYGLSAKIFHIPFVKEVPELKLYAVVQRTPKPDDDAEKDHPGIKSYRSTEDMVKDAAVDVVIITTAPDSHYQLTKLALESGKHGTFSRLYKYYKAQNTNYIYSGLRKTIYPNLPRSRRSQRHRKSPEQAVSRLPKSVPHLHPSSQFHISTINKPPDRRWDADFVTLTKLIKSNVLGRVVEYESHFDRHRPQEPAADASKWKNKVIPGGSAIYDLGTHLLDQAVHLLGKPDRVTAFIGSQRQVNTSGFEDSFTVLLHYNSGLMVTAKAGVVSPEEEQLRFWVKGEEGSFKKVCFVLFFSFLFLSVLRIGLNNANLYSSISISRKNSLKVA